MDVRNRFGQTGATGFVWAENPKVINKKLQDLIKQGHGVQRHGPDVTDQQLLERVVQGMDPMTGTRIDGGHGGAHQYAAHATKVKTAEAYVYAENFARNSEQFIEAVNTARLNRIEVQIPLKDIYGSDFREYVSGVTRYGNKNTPQGYGYTQFSDNSYMAVRYKQDVSGKWIFNTMFPQPE
ncbi:MAG: hypothetical protein KAZ18_04540 [Acinetobacter sp.]|nr:hypothetical protein [Acinetobacter sp.]